MACKYPQQRNWLTGRCKTPCKNHQAINPNTGRCVSKTYLQTLNSVGAITPGEYAHAKSNNGVYKRNQVSFNDYYDDSDYNYGIDAYDKELSDERDGLVEDPSCYPRKRNILTGYCKTPCEAHQAINPATGQCVSKAYLMHLNPVLYDEDEDCTMAANLIFSPSIDQSLASAKTEEMKELIKTSCFTLADVRVARGIQLGSTGPMCGIYSHSQRKSCDDSAIKKALTSDLKACGISHPGAFTPEKFQELVKKAGNDFVWVTHHAVPVLSEPQEQDLRLIVVSDQGVNKILIPKGKTGDDKSESYHTFNEMTKS